MDPLIALMMIWLPLRQCAGTQSLFSPCRLTTLQSRVMKTMTTGYIVLDISQRVVRAALDGLQTRIDPHSYVVTSPNWTTMSFNDPFHDTHGNLRAFPRIMRPIRIFVLPFYLQFFVRGARVAIAWFNKVKYIGTEFRLPPSSLALPQIYISSFQLSHPAAASEKYACPLSDRVR